jgi:hypothetical protein
VRRFNVDDRVQGTVLKRQMFGIPNPEFQALDAMSGAAKSDRLRRQIDSDHTTRPQVSLDVRSTSSAPASHFSDGLPLKVHRSGDVIIELYAIPIGLIRCFKLQSIPVGDGIPIIHKRPLVGALRAGKEVIENTPKLLFASRQCAQRDKDSGKHGEIIGAARTIHSRD